MAFIGSAYGHCAATGRVQGNILLDFDKDDPLLLVGRMCMAFTITFAFPTVVIPARNIMLRSSTLLPYVQPTAPPVKEEVTMLEAIDEPLAKEGGSVTTQPLELTIVEAVKIDGLVFLLSCYEIVTIDNEDSQVVDFQIISFKLAGFCKNDSRSSAKCCWF
jgi:hypothetical protein